jgi:DNA-binding NtrC family response regulator
MFRELENVIERGLALDRVNAISLMDLPAEIQNASGVYRKEEVTKILFKGK